MNPRDMILGLEDAARAIEDQIEKSKRFVYSKKETLSGRRTKLSSEPTAETFSLRRSPEAVRAAIELVESSRNMLWAESGKD